uniref:Protein kinase domain-containing protein n=1 Tax=Daucus carota subsp. sativus TaxID=79200 RepID=A0A175YKL7_DAUCS
MSYLGEIILYDTCFQGVIPQEVDGLFRLKVVRLGRNALEGNIPHTLEQAKRTKKMAAYSRSTTLSSVTVPYIHLHKATNGFSSTNLVGAGGFGSVYQGTSRHQYISSPSRKE